MKKIYIKAFLLSLLILVSCDDSFLDTISTDTYNDENFWKSESELTSVINGCYAVTLAYSDYKLHVDNITPNSYNMSGQVQLAQGTHNSNNDNWFYSVWDLNYKGVGRVNNLLAHIDNVSIDSTLQSRIKGEAYFLRALFYSDLVNFYGGVPLILDAPNFEGQKNLPRNTKEEIINQILTDLNNASTLLPQSYTGTNIGRATKGAALALKSRVLLYESRWEEAAAAAKEVIDLNKYGLFADYRQLFLPANENNKEVIFDVQYASPDYTHGWNLAIDLQLNIAPLPDLINSYYMKDGLPTNESSLYDPAHPYDNRDPRLLNTIAITGYTFKGVTIPTTKYYSTGFGYKKYTTYEDNVKYATDLTASPLNYIVLRYADVMLTYAEAKNESTGADSTVYKALNLVRQRAGIANVAVGLNKDQLREVIRHERRIELAGEGLYYNDIRRWKTAEVVMNKPAYNSAGVVIQNRSFNKDRDYLWPLHSTTLEENPALEQNPNYSN